MIIISICFCIVTTLQQTFHFIDFGKKDNYINLIFQILTLYGIFYLFIQFAINYSAQNQTDKYWGKSKTNTLLEDSIEYRIFMSSLFKCLLVFTSIYSVLSINTKLIPNYIFVYFEGLIKNDFINSLWLVSMFAIYFFYVIIFIKSLSTLQTIIGFQENDDVPLMNKIKNYYAKTYSVFFLDSYKIMDDFFSGILKNDIKPVKDEEKNEMVEYIIDKSFKYFEEYFEKYYETKKLYIDKNNNETCNSPQIVVYNLNKLKEKFQLKTLFTIIFNISPALLFMIRKRNYRKIEREIYSRTKYLLNLFDNLWTFFLYENIKLNSKFLLKLYSRQSELIYKHISLYCDYLENRNYDEENEILNFYEKSHENNTFFEIHAYLSNYIENYDFLNKLNYEVIKRTAFKNSLKKLNTILDDDRNKEDEKKLLYKFYNYAKKILDKCYEFKDDFKKDSKAIFNFPQIIIYNYVRALEYNDLNKDYIEILLAKLDDKYIATYIFYKMLYTCKEESEAKKDILFLQKIIGFQYTSYEICTTENIEFISSIIENQLYSNIGHKIRKKLISFVINNMNKDINSNLIKQLEDAYIDFVTFIEFRFIFYKYDTLRYSIDFETFSNDEVKNLCLCFFNTLINTPKLLKEEFFEKYLNAFFQKINRNQITYYTYHSKCDFRLFYLNSWLIYDKNKFDGLIKNSQYPLNHGFIEYLILNIGYEEYSFLLTNNVFWQISKLIFRNENCSIREYVDNLICKLSECSDKKISHTTKVKIIMNLQKIVYGDYDRLKFDILGERAKRRNKNKHHFL
ncbi:hypothetical protein LL127_19185 [Clostridium estertheticum]|nr:hypothetical protein [Clostridium estertheticum]MCB2305616.1 hypothetical protein [Clostridium estertheticum]MCB2344568.1 hypothetical protein [Clostridium estertheticum]WAG45616.1 hypothetical protein LL127_19185 [Clostridium estertheticum]